MLFVKSRVQLSVNAISAFSNVMFITQKNCFYSTCIPRYGSYTVTFEVKNGLCNPKKKPQRRGLFEVVLEEDCFLHFTQTTGY